MSPAGCSKKSDSRGEPDKSGPAEPPEGEPAPASQDHANPVAAPADSGTWYLVAATHPKEDVRAVTFFASVPPSGSSDPVIVRSGDFDITAVPAWNGDTFTVSFPPMGTRIELGRNANGTLSGTWSSAPRTWDKASLTLSATPVQTTDPAQLFVGTPVAPTVDAAGTWQLTAEDESAVRLVVESVSKSGVVASYTSSLGNSVRLAGAVSGDQLQLSTFDTTIGFQLDATIHGDELSGTWIALRTEAIAEKLSGKRAQAFDLEPTARVIEGERELVIPGVDLGKYKGKPVIVELAGSWCVNCRYAIPFMRDMYDKYHAMGFDIVTLLYEFTDDDAYNRAQAQSYKDNYNVPWDVIAVSGTLDHVGEIMPQTLEGLDLSGLPLAIFVRRDGAIHRVHAGFPPRTLASYKQDTELYEQSIKDILSAK